MDFSQTDTLPVGSSTVEPFDKVISESVAALKDETTQQIKRGRGRPKGTFKVKPAPTEAPKTTEGASATVEPEKVEPIPPPVDLEPLAKDLVKAPFGIAAVAFDMPEMELHEKETEAPRYYLSKLIELYLPGISNKNPKAFALYAFLLSYALLGIKRINKFIEIKKILAERRRQKNQQPPTQHADTVQTSNADQDVNPTVPDLRASFEGRGDFLNRGF